MQQQQLSIRLPLELIRKLRKLAALEQRTPTDLIRLYLDQRVDAEVKKIKAARSRTKKKAPRRSRREAGGTTDKR